MGLRRARPRVGVLTVVMSVLLGMGASACGAYAGAGPGAGAGVGAPPGSDVLVAYRVSGGIAGVDERLVVSEDGRVVHTSRQAPAEHGRLSAEELAGLVAALEASDFATLPPDTVDPNVADAFVYEVTYEGHRVRTSDGAVPALLAPVIERLATVLAGLGPGRAGRALEGPVWQLESIVEGDAVRPLPEGTGATLVFGEGRVAVAVVDCNQGYGDVRIGRSRLVVGTLSMTERACPPAPSAVESAVVAALVGRISYEIDADRLTLAHPAGRGLVLRATDPG